MTHRPLAVVLFEATSLTIFTAIALVTVLNYCGEVRLGSHAWPVFFGAVIGYVAADFISGFVHWFCDTFFEEETPIIGRALIYPFRDHHRDPEAMTHHGFLEMYGNSCAPLTLFLLIVWSFQNSTDPSAWGIGIQTALLVMIAGAFATNQFHAWAHTAFPPWYARILQSTGLIVPSEMHKAHHEYPHRNAYCVTSGWMNSVTDRFGVWDFFESGIRHLGVPKSRTAS